MHSHPGLTNSPDLEAKAARDVCVPALASAKPEENRQTHTLLSPVSKSVLQGFWSKRGLGVSMLPQAWLSSQTGLRTPGAAGWVGWKKEKPWWLHRGGHDILITHREGLLGLCSLTDTHEKPVFVFSPDTRAMYMQCSKSNILWALAQLSVRL